MSGRSALQISRVWNAQAARTLTAPETVGYWDDVDPGDSSDSDCEDVMAVAPPG